MVALEEKVACYIEQHRLFAGMDRVLLAVSGGADSIALLHVLQALRARGVLAIDLACAHVNHQLRGPVGDADEAFVAEVAGLLDLPIDIRRVDVAAEARVRRVSLETAGRQVRIETLTHMARAHRCGGIVTGHQKNDNAETVLHRLARGTGLRGLAGIWPARRFDGGPPVMRPLLCATRQELVAYLRRRGIAWRQDHTNLDPAYTRNRIRHSVLPTLGADSRDDLAEALSQLAAASLRLWRRIEREATNATARLTNVSDGQIVLRAAELASIAEPVAVEVVRRSLVRLGCPERDLTRRHYQHVLRLAHRSRPDRAIVLPGRIRAYRERDAIVLSTPGDNRDTVGVAREPAALAFPGTTNVRRFEIRASVAPATQIGPDALKRDMAPHREFLDFDCISGPVVVRDRRDGDRFQPLGMRTEKKLGKFLTAAGVSQRDRARLLVFSDVEKILWVYPVRIDHRVRVTDRTRRVVLVEVVERAGEGDDRARKRSQSG